jgi:hypothetical protein
MSSENINYAITHYLLSAIYFIFFIYCCTRFLLKKISTKPQKNKTLRNIFNFFLIIASVMRTVFFLLQALVVVKEIAKYPYFVDAALNVMPTLLFFTSYWIMLLLWALIYHGRYHYNSTFVDKSVPLFVTINFAMYSAVITTLVINSKESENFDPANPKEASTFVIVALAVIAFCYLMTAIAAYFYGVRFYRIFVQHVAAIAKRILQLTLFFGSIFLIRTVIVTYGIFDNISKFFWFDLVYYILLELLPLHIMLILLQKTSTLEKKNSLLNNTNAGSFVRQNSTPQITQKNLKYTLSFAAM